MSGIDRDRDSGRIQQMLTAAEELKKAAARTSDPDTRRRLQDRARRLQEESKQAIDKGDEEIGLI
ncbi:DUF6381 family protein [Streptomyces sp. NPDC017993]|uniref:DUF6381 family protein n=1 Tax=Streptomyces sp. NPDC017993 TaxID=3365027 RepID=UPI0037A3F8D7